MNEQIPHHNEFLSFANGLADIARTMIQSAAFGDHSIEIKKDHSFVTKTDREIERELRKQIEQKYPRHGILGEEYGNQKLDAEFVWVLDPIDGTAPLIAGIPVFGSLIALAWKGSPFLGIIEQPITADRWVGVANRFALFNERPAHVRPCENLKDAFVTCSNPDFMDRDQQFSLERLKCKTSYTQYGGACFAYGSLASGRTDIAIDAGLKAFDLFAPAAVITGAGGIISDWGGESLTIDLQGDVLATGDKHVHEAVLSLLNSSNSCNISVCQS